MKTSSDVQDRAKYLLAKELERRVQVASQRLPHQCVHNHRHLLDVRKEVNGESNESYNRIALPVVQSQSIGLCTLGMGNPEEWNGTICEDPIDAQRCPYFVSKVSKEDIRSEFETQIRDMSWLEENLPQVYGLLWVVGEEVRLPWWKRLWFRLLRIRTEPLKQLPSSTDDYLGL